MKQLVVRNTAGGPQFLDEVRSQVGCGGGSDAIQERQDPRAVFVGAEKVGKEGVVLGSRSPAALQRLEPRVAAERVRLAPEFNFDEFPERCHFVFARLRAEAGMRID